MSNTFTIDGNVVTSGSSVFDGDQIITGSLETTLGITASIFKGDGSTITSLNGTNISSGTVAAARVATLNQDTTGNATTATTLANTRTINGVDFNGSADITTVEGNTSGTGAGGTLNMITIGTTEYSVATGTGNGNVETSGLPVQLDFAKFTSGYQIEGRNYTEVRSDLNVADGADVTPSWVPSVNPNYLTSVGTIDLTSGVTGILPVPNGGTGVNTVTADRILIGNGTSALATDSGFTYNTSNKLLSAPTASFAHLIVSQVISSSVINTSGSNIFGDEATDTQTLNGSVIINNASNQASEATALMINGSNIVGTRELQANAFTSTTIGTNTNALTVSTGLNLNSGTTFNGSTAKTISVDVSDFMTNGSNNRIVTATGTDAMNAEANLTFDGSSLGVGASTAPSYELDVFGSIAVQGVAIAAWNSDIVKLGDFDGNGAKLALYDNTSAELVRLDGGKVGIGTTSPGEKLEVVGNISASGFVYGDRLYADNVLAASANGSTLRIGYTTGGDIQYGKGAPNTHLFKGKITASSDISASGTIAGDSFVKGGGTSAQFLKADGSVDSTAYTTNTGTVTGVTGTAPVVSSGGTTPAISMAAASTSANGYLTSTNWNTFNGKTTVVANSGTGDTLSTVTIGGVGYVIPGGTGNGTVTGVTGTAPVVSSGGTSPAISISAATNSSAGSMSAIDKGKIDAITVTSGVNLNTMNSSISSNTSAISGKAASGANTDITSIINSSLTTIGSNAEETTENYINFAAGKIALTQGSNLVVHAGADFRPGTNNSMNLGTSAYMWADAYSRQFISDASTTAIPAFVIDKDSPTTGFYNSGNNQIGITINNSQIGYFNANGIQLNSGIGTSTIGGHLQAHCLGVGTSPSTTSGEIRADGDIIANYSSDKRLKKNIKPISGALDKLLQISGVTFDWIEKEKVHSHKGHDVGVIAQEVEEVLPEVVVTRDNGYKAVNYEKIVPLLIEAIKDLKAEIDELKKSK